MVQDKWLRLDFNNDGHVTFDDIKKGVHELYEFMVNYDYYSKAHEIKSKLYNEAIKYMKRDLQNEDRENEREDEIEDDQKDENALSD